MCMRVCVCVAGARITPPVRQRALRAFWVNFGTHRWRLAGRCLVEDREVQDKLSESFDASLAPAIACCLGLRATTLMFCISISVGFVSQEVGMMECALI